MIIGILRAIGVVFRSAGISRINFGTYKADHVPDIGPRVRKWPVQGVKNERTPHVFGPRERRWPEES